MCYGRGVAEVASRDLRNNTRRLLERVAAGEEITITVDGLPVARLEPIARRPRWMRNDEFVSKLVQADAELAVELRELAGDTTDDAPIR